MAETKRNEEWDQVAWNILHFPRGKKGRASLEKYQPIRLQKKKAMDEKLRRQFAKMRGKLPKHLNDEERQKRWEAFNEKLKAAQKRK